MTRLIPAFHGIGNLSVPRAGLPSAVVFRRLEIEHRQQLEQVSALLQKNHMVGFSTYGEQFDGMHLNQTLTGVALGGVRFE